jgi:hypothetical protein
MNTVGVLLMDDVPGERANFEHAFGRDLTVAPSIDQLNEQLRRVSPGTLPSWTSISARRPALG